MVEIPVDIGAGKDTAWVNPELVALIRVRSDPNETWMDMSSGEGYVVLLPPRELANLLETEPPKAPAPAWHLKVVQDY